MEASALSVLSSVWVPAAPGRCAMLRGCLTKVTAWGHCDFAQSRLSTIWPRPQACCPAPPPQKSLQGVEGLALGLGFVPWHVRECRQDEENIKCLHRHRFASWTPLRGSRVSPWKVLLWTSTSRSLSSHHETSIRAPRKQSGLWSRPRFPFPGNQKPGGRQLAGPDWGMLVDISLVLVCVCVCV